MLLSPIHTIFIFIPFVVTECLLTDPIKEDRKQEDSQQRNGPIASPESDVSLPSNGDPVDGPPPNPQSPSSSPPTHDGSLPGATYIRWGRTTCPTNDRKIYDGVMASSHYNHKGSGSNFLCLPMHPILSPKPKPQRRGSVIEPRGWPSPAARPVIINAPIYGTEYNEVLPNSPNILNSEAPCAVCQATGRQTVVMIPGSVECFGEGWTLEYRGFMMSSLYTAHKSEFICVDDHAEGIHRSGANNEESTIVPVHVKCSASGGGLPCAPYADGQDLPCAVCTQ
ncbi:hypothetical protein BSL78_27983 [Apostichopus japonicus]|uniref:Short-chain collagen C4 n=1 Tax=Stichopus japonicus TaxID=307972 RepID=A0A2G8JHG6_STIJA|nr:hypothetical protein BSL78_27983 [Apostichopus japonicus]